MIMSSIQVFQITTKDRPRRGEPNQIERNAAPGSSRSLSLLEYHGP
jgi:hypothetical protein